MAIVRTKNTPRVTPMTQSRKHSINIDTSKYIEHLESELAAMQTQLRAMTSPTVLQARSFKMRALNAETRALQEEVTEWERKFHERVQQEVEERARIEAGLKSRIKLLESDVEDYTQIVHDLQGQLEKSTMNINAAETANVELERRIDAISGLVAPSMTTEGDRAHVLCKRHSRQKSMLPRFPTAGNLVHPIQLCDSPVTPATIQAKGLIRSSSAEQVVVSHETTNDTDRPASADAPRSGSAKRFSWATPECYTSLESLAAVSTNRPSRRMRKFHAGSVMPKPLLLPSTTVMSHHVSDRDYQHEQHIATSPTLETSSMIEIAPSRDFDFLLGAMPGNGRRRAMTCIEDVAAAMRRRSNPLMFQSPFPAATLKGSSITSSSNGQDLNSSLQQVPSLDSTPKGGNLLDELRRADMAADLVDVNEGLALTRVDSNSSSDTERPDRHASSPSPTCITTITRRNRNRSLSGSTIASSTMSHHHFETEFDDDEDKPLLTILWQGSYNTARNCLVHAQTVTIHSATVQRLQWWVVHILFGPMVSRRLRARAIRRARRHNRAHIPRLRLTEKGENNQINLYKDSKIGHDHPVNHISWITKHNPWLWIRFSLALLFAIGAALREGPGLVMGLSEEEEQMNKHINHDHVE